MGWRRDTSDPAGLSHARLRRRISLPSGTAGTNVGKKARYAGENRDPLQLRDLRRPGASGSVSSATLQAGVHLEKRRAAAPVGRSGAGGQDRPASRDTHSESDLRDRLSGSVLWVPAGTKPASSAGCVDGRDREEEGELDIGLGHSGIFRQFKSRTTGPVCGRANRQAIFFFFFLLLFTG